MNAIRLAASYRREDRAVTMSDILNPLRPAGGEEDLREFAWRYLWRQAGRMSILRGHEVGVTGAAFSEDALFTVSSEGLINLWDVETRRLLSSVPIRTSQGGGKAFSRDAQRLATCVVQVDAGAQLYYWDARRGELLAELSTPWEVIGVAMSPDGRRIAAVGGDSPKGRGVVMVWEPATGRSDIVWRQEGGTATAVDFSDDGNLLAFAVDNLRRGGHQDNCALYVLDLSTGEVRPPLLDSADAIFCVAFSPDGGLVAAGGHDRCVRVWDLTTGRTRFTFANLELPVSCMAFAPNGRTLAVGMYWPGIPTQSDGKYCALWDLTTGTRRELPLFRELEAHSVAFSEDGEQVGFGCAGGEVRLADLTVVSESWDLLAHTPKEAWGVAFASKAPVLATSGDDHEAVIWDVANRQEIARCVGAPSLLAAVAFAPRERLLASAGFDGALRLWDPDTGEEKGMLAAHKGPVRAVAFSPNGQLLASGGDDQTVKLWSVATSELQRSLAGHSNKVRALQFTDKGETLYTAGNDTHLLKWRTSTGELLLWTPASADITSLAHSPQTNLLAVGKMDGDIDLRHAETGELVRVLKGHTEGVLCVAFSPDGRSFASGGMDQTVRVWHLATGQPLLRFNELPHQVNGVAFSADSRTLAAAYHNGTVRLWQAAP